MNTSPKYFPSILKSNSSQVDFTYWDRVMDFYDAKQYKETAIGVIRYANPTLFEKFGNADKTEFNIPHGSVVINIRVTDETFKVSAPFLIIPRENPIPLYRQVAQLNFSPLNLTNILLKGEQLSFEYECPIETCEPYKIWDVLYDICIYADNYDDKFIEQFNAERINEPIVKNHPPEKLTELYDNVMTIVDEALQYISHFEQKRWEYFTWDIIAITLFKIDNYCFPQGFLRTELEKEISYQMTSQDPIPQRINYAKEFLKKLQDWDAEKFKNDLYDIENFVSPKRSANDEAVKGIIKNIYERAKKEFDKKDYLACSLSVQYIFYYLLYYNTVEDKYSNVIYNALKKVGGKPWEESGKILFKAIDNIMTGNLSAVSFKSGKKGFFARLFNN
ncbi:hypothetical protein OOZ15_02240 [Galbibacter sp. EGI 63066]|uniref:hypothetical protein n=1 Tax=Galbibacter sp. EGI 63066 TaxID=2993559 RepID=UPI0022494F15|nr:hypothetical protein [Galbibacter sp. EGI 63066]MCX2678749.1 hypothetical protein [Galbibacter sp. EGI 63066]